MINKSKTKNTVIIAGLVAILLVPLASNESAFAGKAAYFAIQTANPVTEADGNVYVYRGLLGNLGEYMVSIIYVSQSASGYTVGAGYYGIGTGSSLDDTYKISYLDNGSTYDNIHYFGSSITSEGYINAKMEQVGSDWKTYHNGVLHKTLACPSGGCPTMALLGVATNTNTSLSNVIFAGTFDTLKGTTSAGYKNWSQLVNDKKCNASTGAYSSATNSYNSGTMGEASPGGTANCGTVTWGWFYNNQLGAWGV